MKIKSQKRKSEAPLAWVEESFDKKSAGVIVLGFRLMPYFADAKEAKKLLAKFERKFQQWYKSAAPKALRRKRRRAIA